MRQVVSRVFVKVAVFKRNLPKSDSEQVHRFNIDLDLLKSNGIGPVLN